MTPLRVHSRLQPERLTDRLPRAQRPKKYCSDRLPQRLSRTGWRVFIPHPGNAKLFFSAAARERDLVSDFEQAVNSLQKRTSPADIDGHHALAERTAADIDPVEQDGKRDFDAGVAAFAKPLGTQIAEELFLRQ